MSLWGDLRAHALTRWSLGALLAVTLWACGPHAPAPVPEPEPPRALRILLAPTVDDTATLCVAPTPRMQIDYDVAHPLCLTVGALRDYLSVRRQAEKD